MDKVKVSNREKLLAAIAYALALPALYILLSDKRSHKYLEKHAARAIFLWIAIVIIWIFLRVVLYAVWNVIYIPFLDSLVSILGFCLWLYAIYAGYKAALEEKFEIPYVTDFADKFTQHQ